MNGIQSFIFSLICAVPAALGMVKYKRVFNVYKPFILLMLAAFFTELIAGVPIVVANNHTLQNIVYPVYTIIEIYLWLLFYKENNIEVATGLWWMLPLITGVVYISGLLVPYRQYQNLMDYSEVCFFIVMIILSVKMLGNEIYETQTKAFKNPKMIIAFGCLLFYSYDLLESVFTQINSRTDTRLPIFFIHQVANVLSYIIFTWAILCIPRKPKY